MGAIFSTSKRQQERTVEEVLRAIIEAVAVAFIIRADAAAGLRSALGTEVTVGLGIVVMHLLWEEIGEPFSGFIKGLSGLFIQ